MTDTGKLEVTTPTDREIVMTRVFNAPCGPVFDAWTRPELLKRWLLGPPGWTMPVCEIDLRVGGTYRYVWRGQDGTEFGMSGDYQEIVPAQRIVHTERYEEDPTGGEALVTLALTEQDGRTTATTTMLFASREARDGALGSGMEHGVAASYDQLDKLLASTPAHQGARARA